MPNKKSLNDLWKEAEETGQSDLGDRVFCDECSEEWTGREDSGGFLLGSHAVCPKCAPRILNNVKKYNEEVYIRAFCSPDKSFWQWCLSLRGGNNHIRIIEIDGL